MTTELAYFAGAMDADGTFGIKRDTFKCRSGEASQPTFYARIGLKQVVDVVPLGLKEAFGGSFYPYTPKAENRKKLWVWECTARQATDASRQLLPFLRIKRAQVKAILALEETRDPRILYHAFWFMEENPGWETECHLTPPEAGKILGYTNSKSVYAAMQNGTLLSVKRGRRRFLPERFIQELAAIHSGPGRPPRPRQVMERRSELWDHVRHLNKTGVEGTPVFHRTGLFKPL